jgi:hypothetical protein
MVNRKLLIVAAMVLASWFCREASAAEKHDPCSFLKVSAVEAIMGPLSGPPYRSSGGVSPAANGGECRYEAKDLRNIRLKVEWDGGKAFMSMLGSVQSMVESAGLKQLKLMDGSTVAGHWDQAALNSCCEFNAVKDDILVTVDISGSRATVAQAASLADAAIQRLDSPLNVNGADGMQAAQDRAAQRPKPRNVCDLVSQSEAEAMAGTHLSQPPKGSNTSCTYSWPFQGSDFELKLMVVWRDGFSEMRTTQAAVGNASAMLGMNKPQQPADQKDGQFDEFSKSIIGVSAVKNDVMVSIEGGPFLQNVQQAFIEKAVSNIGK